jgi:hypothetical protein
MSSAKSSLIAAVLAALAAGLLGAGFALDRPLSAPPRITVTGGGATLGSAEAGEGTRLPVGVPLTIESPGAGVTVLQGDGTSFTLSGGGAVAYAGRTSGGHSYRLGHGKLFCRPGSAEARLLLSCRLGDVEARGALVQVFATAPVAGAAYDTPRALELRVARGSVRLTPRGKPEGSAWVPAGVLARLLGGEGEVRFAGPLSSDHWKAMTGSAPAFAAAGLACADIPAGVWVRRSPGSRGPTPGSRSAPVMFYSAAKRGGVLRGGGSEDSWLYSALEDRWRRLTAADPAGPEPGARGNPCAPPDSCTWSAHAHSPAARNHLIYAITDEGPGTWVLRESDRALRRLEPQANPVPRSDAALYYDAAADLFVLFGGRTGESKLDDLWVFRLAP